VSSRSSRRPRSPSALHKIAEIRAASPTPAKSFPGSIASPSIVTIGSVNVGHAANGAVKAAGLTTAFGSVPSGTATTRSLCSVDIVATATPQIVTALC
jgi:hypothetical protein